MLRVFEVLGELFLLEALVVRGDLYLLARLLRETREAFSIAIRR